jgi:tetraacyldisaccharide 4'-kinase
MSWNVKLAAFAQNVWRKRGPVAIVLYPLALLYGLMVSLRRLAYRHLYRNKKKVRAPVLVVGNVFIGGTGKTPLVIWLIEQLRLRGFTPGVVSRGYGRYTSEGSGAGRPVSIVRQGATPASVGDEPILIWRRTGVPICVGRNRLLAAQHLLEMHPDIDVLISDDGLQHYALPRDLELVLFDGRGAGNGWLLPAGPLRESLHRPRDYTLYNGARAPSAISADAWQMQLAHPRITSLYNFAQAAADSEPLYTWARREWVGTLKKMAAVAGIGNPRRFFDTLAAEGLICMEVGLPDHFSFDPNPFPAIYADIILITEKDAVKCIQLSPVVSDRRIWVVSVSAVIDTALADDIVEKLRGFQTA